MDVMQPFTKMVDLKTGEVVAPTLVQTRCISDLRGLFTDARAEAELVAQNPIVYQVFEGTDNPAVAGQLRFSTTVIYPGKVGDEYFFTKGHYHALADRAELYYGLTGEGYLLLQLPDGTVSAQRMTPGAAAFVPPYWAHRTINVGTENFSFLACYPADAGYDYKTIAEKGFAQILVEREGKPTLIPNPRWA